MQGNVEGRAEADRARGRSRTMVVTGEQCYGRPRFRGAATRRRLASAAAPPEPAGCAQRAPAAPTCPAVPLCACTAASEAAELMAQPSNAAAAAAAAGLAPQPPSADGAMPARPLDGSGGSGPGVSSPVAGAAGARPAASPLAAAGGVARTSVDRPPIASEPAPRRARCAFALWQAGAPLGLAAVPVPPPSGVPVALPARPPPQKRRARSGRRGWHRRAAAPAAARRRHPPPRPRGRLAASPPWPPRCTGRPSRSRAASRCTRGTSRRPSGRGGRAGLRACGPEQDLFLFCGCVHLRGRGILSRPSRLGHVRKPASGPSSAALLGRQFGRAGCRLQSRGSVRWPTCLRAGSRAWTGRRARRRRARRPTWRQTWRARRKPSAR